MGGTVYAVAGGKGGVGKTTVTVNAAVALGEMGYDVAAVDADIAMADLATVFGVDAERSVHRVLAGEERVENVGIEGPGGVTVVPGERRVEAVADADPANLRDVLDPLVETHDIVLVDTGAGIGHPQLVAYGLADAAVLVTTQEEPAVAGVEKTAEMVEHVDGTLLGAAVTGVRAGAEEPVPDELVRDLGLDLLAAVPEYGEQVKEPRVLHADDAVAAEYERLGTALAVFHQLGDVTATADRVEQAREEEAEPDEPGLFGRLASRVSR